MCHYQTENQSGMFKTTKRLLPNHCAGGASFGLEGGAMNVAQVWPDSVVKFPWACWLGDGGMTMRCLQAGH
jgi:hypothetical protein